MNQSDVRGTRDKSLLGGVSPVPHAPGNSHTFIPPHGGYEDLLSYKKAQIVFDATLYFCRRFLDKRDRTFGQMVQAARSGKQNIVEGSQVSGTSKELELKLTNVARASLEELLEDYYDFLRVRVLRIWEKEDKEARYARKMGMQSPLQYEEHYHSLVETRSAAVVANLAICLLHQTNYLLDHLMN